MELQKTKHQIKLEYWKKQVYECHRSGITKKAWCEANHISEQTYYRWQKLVWEAGTKNTALKPVETNEATFAEYRPRIISTDTPALTVRLGETSLEIRNGADLETIEVTLRALKNLQVLC